MRVICGWCAKVKQDGPEPTSHGICGGCVAKWKSSEMVKFSLVMSGCPPFEEVMTRMGAASILRAIRFNENYITHSLGVA